MKIEIGKVKKSVEERNYTDYMVAGVISRCNSLFESRPVILRDSITASLYFDTESREYAEISKILDTGHTVLIRNAYEDKKIYHSWLTPVRETLILPCKRSKSNTLEVLRSPINFNGETYVIHVRYDPSQIVHGGEFHLNLPSGWVNPSIDTEFVSSISCILLRDPDNLDTDNEVFSIVLMTEGLLGDVFDELAQYFDIDTSDENYIRPYLSKSAENDRENGVFSIYFNQPLRYLPKSIAPSNLEISYSYFDNIEYLEDYVPMDTITYESKMVGDCSDLIVKLSEGVLSLSLGILHEEFEVSGDRDSGKFIGDIQSKLVSIIVNTNEGEDVTLIDFESRFHPASSLQDASIDINKSIDNLLDSDMEVNSIILSESLVYFDLSEVDVTKLEREFLLVSRDTEIFQLAQDYLNTVKFSGRIDGVPVYIKFLEYLYNCNYTELLPGLAEVSDEKSLESYSVWHPKVVEYYNVLDFYGMPEFAVNMQLDLDKVMVFQVMYAMAISKFILRYKWSILFSSTAVIGRLRNLLNKFRYKFPSIEGLELIASKIDGNDITVGLRTSLVSILKYKSITLNFNLKI